ncbi:hypothetical protein SKAU_G00284510 [Synaphobranchus kaupii]|uniref:Uncharacterized protein n=1 Tax=Synaphobranchus kaupii TaxID=118154 RepID=A0A9Q1IPA1_SYNKA|nr:hypothetical protein SKAU_G00284510 [Synaphobranchus kaupii]
MGGVQDCQIPCCHASTCRLNKGAECATGDCCKNCRFASASTECRSQRDQCDLAEFCTGRSAQCPEDVLSHNGIPCKGGQGFCRNGRCPLLADQCVRMWGDAARVGRDFCYEQNTQGTYFGFCRRSGPENYIPCKEKDVMCGKLFCTGGNKEPGSGLAAVFSSCTAMYDSDQSQDQGLVDTGTRCGDELVCMDNQCVDLEVAYGATNCSAQCKGYAVCNHKSQCQCEPGWLPPDCEYLDSSDQAVSSASPVEWIPTQSSQKALHLSLSPGTVIAIVIGTGTIVVFLLALSGVAVILKRRQRLSRSPRLPPQEKDLGQNNPAFPTINTVYQNHTLKNMTYPNYPQVK